ncbi:hypothetical protein CA13_60290 [Planctomycetes bacterium CA13]|uniref:UPF0056 membrane protein n=1 Tax=Novipirellula herctigrandis TaxID=2527986 RepID=A0A5C5ZAZ4_9BACT|nr:hypothetical protein CA13_60290 [Planctomycetes bacterium CA13]
MDWNFLTQAVTAMLVITAPPDPAKILLFNSIVDESRQSRMAAAIKVALIVAGILGGAALGGAEFAELLGINLDVFSVVGGIVVAGMGFEMLYGGKRSKAQGQEATEQDAEEEGGLIMPLAIPLIAGPGAIVTSVTISTSNDDGMVAALIGSAAVALMTFISFRFLGGLLSKLSDRATALMLRLGGMLLATIGLQMLLGGLKNFFAT